jgi:hypothetical protein
MTTAIEFAIVFSESLRHPRPEADRTHAWVLRDTRNAATKTQINSTSIEQFGESRHSN